jgi:hypothetical protein
VRDSTGIVSQQTPSWTINPKSRNVSARIETARTIMYASYAAALVSLPVLFYVLGEYTQYNNGWIIAANKGNMAKSDELRAQADQWQNINTVCIGVTSALTVNFIVQLVIYLVRANAVIPEEAKAN